MYFRRRERKAELLCEEINHPTMGAAFISNYFRISLHKFYAPLLFTKRGLSIHLSSSSKKWLNSI
jgi:hypothetical protein